MNNEQRQFVGESYIEMYQSLIDSVKQAGGEETAFYYDEIKDMTVSSLFNALATNGIRFTREIPEEDQEEMFDYNKFRENYGKVADKIISKSTLKIKEYFENQKNARLGRSILKTE